MGYYKQVLINVVLYLLTLSVSAIAEPAFVASVFTTVVSSSRSFFTASRTDADLDLAVSIHEPHQEPEGAPPLFPECVGLLVLEVVAAGSPVSTGTWSIVLLTLGRTTVTLD